jgi:hypothetical protein
MCMQCMAGAMTAVGAASGVRAYLGRVRSSWLTPRRLRVMTILLVIAALVAPATLLSGSSATPASGQEAPTAQR